LNVLFDLDGTLTDPKVGITTSIADALTRMGRVPPHPDRLAWCIGPPLLESLATILETTDEAACRRCLGFYRERFADVGLYENQVYDGIPELLTDFRAEGHRLYVATSKPTVYAVLILDHFGLTPHFTAVYGCELDGTRANKGELIGHLLASEGLDPRECVMVGDREHDVRGAARHGIPCVGVTYGYGSESELRSAGATVLVSRPAQLKGALGTLTSDRPVSQ